MLTVIGVLGGGALSRALQGNKHKKLEEELKTKAKELEETNKVLQTFEVERTRVDEHIARANDYKEVAEKLQRERDADAARLSTLAAERDALHAQVQQLQAQSETQAREHAAQVEGLKTRVSEVLQRLLAHAISEHEAAEQLEGLGCHVEFVDASTTVAEDVQAAASTAECLEWNGQTQLLLDNKDRIERLVACATPRPGQQAQSSGLLMGSHFPAQDWQQTRVPVVTFPQLMGGLTRALVPPLRLQDMRRSPAQEGSHGALGHDTSVMRDQAAPADGRGGLHGALPPGGDGAAAAAGPRKLEELQSKGSLKFVYSAQAKPNANPWTGKLPAEGLPTAGGYMTSTSPTPTHRDAHVFGDDGGFGSAFDGSSDVSLAKSKQRLR